MVYEMTTVVLAGPAAFVKEAVQLCEELVQYMHGKSVGHVEFLRSLSGDLMEVMFLGTYESMDEAEEAYEWRSKDEGYKAIGEKAREIERKYGVAMFWGKGFTRKYWRAARES